MPTTVSLSQMVDLSLGTPEIGSVNFNVMHTLFHAIIKHLSIGDVKADINEHDRDFLASSKFRARSTLSDADSGRGYDSEDATSEKSVPPFKPPYHQLELKVAKVMEQMEELNSLPSNKQLYERTTQSKGDSADRPVADMWQYMQLKKRVDANEEGVGKLFSLIEDMMKDMQQLKDQNKKLQDQIKSLDVDDLLKRLKQLEKMTGELNEKFSTLPTPEELAQFVTWPTLEDALKGIRTDMENMQPPERVVIEHASQTEVPSRPGSSRPMSRMSTASSGPSDRLLEILERLGRMDEDHNTLKARVDALEEELKNKLDKSALEGLGVSSEFAEQLGKLKEELDALAAAREKAVVLSGDDSHSHSGAHHFLASIINMLLKIRQAHEEGYAKDVSDKLLATVNKRMTLSDTPGKSIAVVAPRTSAYKGPSSSDEEPSSTSDRDTDHEGTLQVTKGSESNLESSESEDILTAIHHQQTQDLMLDALNKKIGVLEDRFKVLQDMLLDDSAYHSTDNISDMSSWLEKMENKLADQAKEVDEIEEKKAEEEERAEKERKEQVEKQKEGLETKASMEQKFSDDALLEELFASDLDSISSGTLISAVDLEAINSRMKKLAYTLNDQLHTVRDKVFLLDNELKRMAKGVEFALLRSKVGGHNEMDMSSLGAQLKDDSEALSRAQHAILQLQAEVEKLHHVTTDIIAENKNRTKQMEDLLAYCDRLQNTKADKEYVQMEVDVKADKRTLDNKVNHGLFDQTTNEINRMIKEILDKLAGNEEDWKSAYGKLTDDIEGKLDRLELDPLKEWLEGRLKALNEKLKKYQTSIDWSEDDAAGIRKQLIQRFHCISCDRPVDMMPTGPVPSLPSHQGLPGTRSPRPYTTFELDQIRQHAKRIYHGADRHSAMRFTAGRNTVNFERALAERQLASLKKSDLKAFLIHFKQDFDAYNQCRAEHFGTPEVTDYYATPRPCGGSHTMTFPHKRSTKLTHLSHLFREEDTVTFPVNKDEVDVQGIDGHIYRGRSEPPRPHTKLEARLPTNLGSNNNNISVNVQASSQPPQNRPQKFISPARGQMTPQPPQQRSARPTSARTPPSPRPTSAQQGPGSRPQSARPVSSRTTPVPDTPAPTQADGEEPQVSTDTQQQQTIQLDMPSATDQST